MITFKEWLSEFGANQMEFVEAFFEEAPLLAHSPVAQAYGKDGNTTRRQATSIFRPSFVPLTFPIEYPERKYGRLDDRIVKGNGYSLYRTNRMFQPHKEAILNRLTAIGRQLNAKINKDRFAEYDEISVYLSLDVIDGSRPTGIGDFFILRDPNEYDTVEWAFNEAEAARIMFEAPFAIKNGIGYREAFSYRDVLKPVVNVTLDSLSCEKERQLFEKFFDKIDAIEEELHKWGYLKQRSIEI